MGNRKMKTTMKNNQNKCSKKTSEKVQKNNHDFFSFPLQILD
jgi:hypothetical protein